jgi:hypothetical protein
MISTYLERCACESLKSFCPVLAMDQQNLLCSLFIRPASRLPSGRHVLQLARLRYRIPFINTNAVIAVFLFEKLY